ncbi:hypothetical protein FE392_10820 [Xenorhabdus sp. 12]|uniref:Uncharacterized protein n=1 Tax=Xenorhabdus santafensis TaxID=2582833 RepID=A0ABU4SAI8_9GAMM|nr:hypothetical protein [Xenorhabdus sp. 12]MDX7987818.1 hypothetical protein [Xenorhabdus sp. 12]
MFQFTEFERLLRIENPAYEYFGHSSLHTITQLVRGGFGSFHAIQLAAEMTKVPAIKWQKYARTRKYLMSEYPGLREQLCPRLVNFRTSRWEKGAKGSIIHMLNWQSSTGILDDLMHIRLREDVCWQTHANGIQHYVTKAYREASTHNGLVDYTPGSLGIGCDEHDALGPFNTTEARAFTGPGELEFVVTQTYQQSANNGVSWANIPDSTYRIRRILRREGNQLRITIHKENQSNPTDVYSNTSVV